MTTIMPVRTMDTPEYRLDIDGWEYAVTRMPDIKCKYQSCYGRGWTGRQKHTGQPVMCSCVGSWELLNKPKGGIKDDPLNKE